jgi:hypothetical protein
MEEEFYAVVKLKNGEELFAEICPTVENGKEVILLYHPVTITQVRRKNGYAYSVEPWIKIGNEGLFVINADEVITMSEIDDDNLITMHNKYVESREAMISSEKSRYNEEKINQSMGYIGTVTEAMKTLERIYNLS